VDGRVSAERWNAIMSIFADAVELPPDERSAFVAQACGSDAELLREVVSLLMAHNGDAEFLESPAVKAGDDAPDLGARLQDALGTAFRVERELAGGGMSRVFVAEETKLGRHVVVKVLPPELRAVMSIERFHRETRLAAALRHPHIVPLLAAGESADGLVYFTMPYLEGESLQRRLEREGRLPLADVVAIVREVADALAYAHANGVVHRDVKPANVLIDGRHAVVADFGLAKAIALARGEWDRSEHGQSDDDGSSPLTLAGFVLGTPAYMSPEQAKGGDLDARTDVYSLGCMTFEMLTGQLPFPDTGLKGIVRRVREPPPAPSTHCPDLPRAVDDVVARALAPSVDDRFQSTTALAEALGAAASLTLSTDSGEHAPPTRPAWRRPWIAAAALVVAAGAMGGAAALWRLSTPTPGGAADGVGAPRAGQPTAPPTAAATPSLAVLPFENIGPAEDAYFAQGVGDGLASRLTGVSGVRMTSPASTRLYRNTTKSRAQVGQELGVDYLLDGHVRWDKADQGPRRVRVTVELVRSRDGTSVWADRYDATSEDLFAMEGSIGEKVAAALQVALEEPERKSISARPTTNFEAYTYFLRGEALRTAPEDNAGASMPAVAMFERAVALDPRFALAFARMAQTHSEIYWSNGDRTAKRLALMRQAAEMAVRLDPDLPEARLALGLFYYRGQRDYARATREIDIALQRQPGHGELLLTRGLLLRRQGRFAEAAASLARAAELDPRSHEIAWSVAWTYGAMRAYPDAVRYLERTLALAPRWSALYADLGLALVMWRGDVTEGRRIVAQGMALPDAGRIVDRLRFQAEILVGYTARDSAVVRRLTPDMFHGDTSQYLLWNADWARRHGEAARVRAYADSARTLLERRVKADSGEPGPRMLLALTYAQLGRKADALREGTRAVEMLPVSRDAIDGGEMQEDMAYVETLVGEADAAITRLAYLLTIPSDISIPLLRVDPVWKPLRGDPRFKRLVASPAS